jgi:hypothetical protein
MKTDYKDILASTWLRSALILVIVYFSQVYPFHHLHDEGVLVSEIGSHPIQVDEGHSSDHHHDGATPHTDDHRHAYDEHIDWHIIRTQDPRTLSFDDQSLFSSTSSVFAIDLDISLIDYKRFIGIDGHCVPASAIRGPPLLG